MRFALFDEIICCKNVSCDDIRLERFLMMTNTVDNLYEVLDKMECLL